MGFGKYLIFLMALGLMACSGIGSSDYSSNMEAVTVGNGDLEAKLTWTPNEESDLSGYIVHYGDTSGSYIESVNVGLPNLVDGLVSVDLVGFEQDQIIYFAITAYDVAGNISSYSAEASKDFRP